MSPNGLPRQWRTLGVVLVANVLVANVATSIGCSNGDDIREGGAAEQTAT
jgi:hypothetical protein